jgi:hypothetical protein
VSRNGRPNTVRAWATIRGGLRGDNRQAFTDAAYELICEDYAAINAVVSEAGLDKPTIRMLAEDAADRTWLEDWQQYDRSQHSGGARVGRRQPASPGTRPTGRQSRATSPETARNPDNTPAETNTPDSGNPDTCGGCGDPLTGKRRGARFHNDACRKRAKRAATGDLRVAA